MLARLRKTRDENEGGFTLIELLVVMIIIGILAAIAIPVFLSQRKKAQDSAAKADVSTIGKELATYFVDGQVAPTGVTISAAPSHYLLNVAISAAPVQAAIVDQDLGKASANNVVGTSFYSATAFCVTITNNKGDKAVTGYKYSSAGGLAEGVCGAVTG